MHGAKAVIDCITVRYFYYSPCTEHNENCAHGVYSTKGWQPANPEQLNCNRR